MDSPAANIQPSCATHFLTNITLKHGRLHNMLWSTKIKHKSHDQSSSQGSRQHVGTRGKTFGHVEGDRHVVPAGRFGMNTNNQQSNWQNRASKHIHIEEPAVARVCRKGNMPQKNLTQMRTKDDLSQLRGNHLSQNVLPGKTHILWSLTYTNMGKHTATQATTIL